MNKEKILVKCECDNYYKFINKLKDLSIEVYNIKYKNNIIYFTIYFKDYDKLIKYLPSYKFIIVENLGIFKLIKILKKQYIFVISIIIGIFVFYLCNNMIISIEVIHENPEIRELITDELKKYGVKVISFKKKYAKLNEIRHKILDSYPDKLDWIEIENHGMKYVVKVEERLIKQNNDENNECNVYAKKDGVIKSIKLTRGVSNVNIGDYVNKGDLLISSDVVHNEQIKNVVCAKGSVRAEKWYQVVVDIPLKYQEDQVTGKKKTNFIFEHENYTKRLLKPRLENYISKKTNLFDLFGYKLFLEKQQEIKKIDKEYSVEEAINQALLKSEENIKLKLNKDEYVVDKKVLKNTTNDSTIEVVVFVITDEVIN